MFHGVSLTKSEVPHYVGRAIAQKLLKETEIYAPFQKLCKLCALKSGVLDSTIFDKIPYVSLRSAGVEKHSTGGFHLFELLEKMGVVASRTRPRMRLRTEGETLF